MRFGYLPVRKSFDTEVFLIRTLPELHPYEEIRASWPGIEDGWAYPPLLLDKRFTDEVPLRPAPAFGLRASHEVLLVRPSETDDADLRYLILSIGFLNGLHLLPEGWVHFQRTAIQPGKLVGFIVRADQEASILETMLTRFRSTDEDCQNRLYGLIHWFLMAQEYLTQHDKFMAQYLVTDAAFSFACASGLITRGVPHAQRSCRLCQVLDLEIPEWAIVDSTGRSYLSNLRNALFHEAIFAGQPIGFSHPDRNTAFGLERLNELFILGLSGLNQTVASYPNKILRMTYLVEMKTAT